MKKLGLGIFAALLSAVALSNITVTPPPITPPSVTVQPPGVTPPAISVTPPAVIVNPPSVSPAPVTIQPAAVQPPAITVTTAQEVADLKANGYTVTPPSTTNPPPPPPPPGCMTASGPGAPWAGVIIDCNGFFDQYWANGGCPVGCNTQQTAGNWNSSMTETQNQTAPDGGKALQLSPTGAWPILIQHPPSFPGFPSQNGIAINIQPYGHIRADICPTAPGLIGTLTLNSVAGAGTYVGPNPPVQVTDNPIGNGAPFGNNLAPNVCTTVTVAVSALGIPDNVVSAPYTIYKFMWQENLNPGQTVYFRNMAFITWNFSYETIKRVPRDLQISPAGNEAEYVPARMRA